MSNSTEPKPGCSGSNVHRLILAAEAGQKADIMTYSSGHLGPHSLNQGQPHMGTKQFFWKMSQCQEETPSPVTLQQRRTKALTCVKNKALKESPSEVTASTALAECEVSESRRDQATDHSSHADKREDTSQSEVAQCSSSNSRDFSHKVNPSSDMEGRCQSDQEGQNNEDQPKTNQWLGRQFIAKETHWAGINVAEKHEKKLQKELKKLSVQSWPSRDRLAVFSDVFDDVCESSPVFGRILREIKTDYDLYVNHLMDSHLSLYGKSLNTSLEDPSTGKLREVEVEEAAEEVCRLEEEFRTALRENKRVQNKLQNVPAIAGPEDSDMKNIPLSGLQNTDHTNSMQFKRLQVLNTWKEVQQLEEEIKESQVSTVTATDTERRIKDLRRETVGLIASNERLKAANKNMENKINSVLNREKLNKTMRRMLWDEIRDNLQTDSE